MIWDGKQGLHNLVAPIGARKERKRLGRGEGSGLGKTSGRGHKGQKARKSGNVRIGFEGGQVPLARRLPKRGFSNYGFRQSFEVVNLFRIEQAFKAGAVIEPASLVAAGLLQQVKSKVKLLGFGELNNAYTIRVHAASESAVSKVTSKGGSVEIIGK
jgi:large subunit ribosomal protein L15